MNSIWTSFQRIVYSDSQNINRDHSSDSEPRETESIFGMMTRARRNHKKNVPQKKELSEFKHFIELAPEIRNRIYELLLEEDHEVVFDMKQTPIADLNNLALANKQISNEARSLYFSINKFRLESHFQSTDQSARFLRVLPVKCVSQVKHLTINTFMGINRREQRLLGTNLDSEFWWDLGERQVVNLISTWDIVMNHFPGLESITVEFGKVSFVPFSMYAPDLVLGDNVKLLAKSLQELCKLPEFKKIVLRQKQDLKLDWLLEGMVEEQGEWQGVVKLEQA